MLVNLTKGYVKCVALLDLLVTYRCRFIGKDAPSTPKILIFFHFFQFTGLNEMSLSTYQLIVRIITLMEKNLNMCLTKHKLLVRKKWFR